jgi:hypothetical protein
MTQKSIRLFFSSLFALHLGGCATPDNQDDIDVGSSNKIAQSPCSKHDIEPFYVSGVWVKGDLLTERM